MPLMIDSCLFYSRDQNIYLHAGSSVQTPWTHHPHRQRQWSHQATNVIAPTFSTEAVTKRLQKIQPKRAVALAVVVNSPGGLPVQSQIICDKVKNYASKHNLKLYTFARDVAASGGYMVLCGGDHVVADRSSIVGSIGVIFQKMKLKGLFDRFDIDMKSLTTNEYFFPQQARCFKTSSRRNVSSQRRSRLTLKQSVSEDTRSL